MRVRTLLCLVCLLAPILAGCVDEPAPTPGAVSAQEAVPDETALGDPAPWAAELGVGRYAPVGTPRLYMVFAVESTAPDKSPFVEKLYNLRELVTADQERGDGRTAEWLFQYEDEAGMAIQYIASATSDGGGSSWGAPWYWSYWILAAPERPIGSWTLDSTDAAAIAAQGLDGWDDAGLDRFYMLYRPPGDDSSYWLVGLLGDEGPLGHLFIDATDGTLLHPDDVYPLPVAQRGQTEELLLPEEQAEVEHPLTLEDEYGRIIVRVRPVGPGPVGEVSVQVEGEEWTEVARTAEGDGTVVVEATKGSPGLTNATARVRLEGVATRYTLEWCADGRAADLFDRAATACDGLRT